MFLSYELCNVKQPFCQCVTVITKLYVWTFYIVKLRARAFGTSKYCATTKVFLGLRQHE